MCDVFWIIDLMFVSAFHYNSDDTWIGVDFVAGIKFDSNSTLGTLNVIIFWILHK